VPVDADGRAVGTRVREVTALGDDFHATDRELCDRMRHYLGHIEDMPDDERLFMLGALWGALERHLYVKPPGRT
jgi:hypothetical protein